MKADLIRIHVFSMACDWHSFYTWPWLSRECCDPVAAHVDSTVLTDDAPNGASCFASGNCQSPKTAGHSQRMEWSASLRLAPTWDSWKATESNSSRRSNSPFEWWESSGAWQWPSEKHKSMFGKSMILRHLKKISIRKQTSWASIVAQLTVFPEVNWLPIFGFCNIYTNPYAYVNYE